MTMLLVNVTIGIALITLAQPVTEEITGVGAGAAAALVSVLGIWNGLGRPGLAALSDRTGRMRVYAGMLLGPGRGVRGAAARRELRPLRRARVRHCALLRRWVRGQPRAATIDFFGTENDGAVFGAMIVAWSAGGAVGPLAISELREATGTFAVPLWTFAAVSLVAVVLPLVAKPHADRRPELREEDESEQAE